MAITPFTSSLLLSYMNARATAGAVQSPAHAKTASALVPPWDISIPKPAKESEDVRVRGSDPYFDPKDTSLSGASSRSGHAASELEAILSRTLAKSPDDAKTDALTRDNNKLFALYKALNRLNYIAEMATRDSTTSGQLAGLDEDFQDGLSQVLSFMKKATFDNLTVMAGTKTDSTQSAVSVPYAPFNYVGKGVIGDKAVFTPVAGVSASDQFTISVTKAGVSTDVVIDLANVSGPLTIDNIDVYVNQQLSAAGFGTRFTRTQTGGSLIDGTATWGVQIANTPGETVTLSSADAKPALYIAGTSGASADQQGRLVKLDGLDGAPESVFSAAAAPASGTAGAKATAVDANGNVFVVGQATGSFGNQLNQGAEDVYLTKYDSVGQVEWTRLLGSAESANAYGLAVDASGNVVVAGSVTGNLTPSAVGGGTDSFVAKYDTQGNQSWVRQVAPLSDDQANSVSIDASGNIYVAGQVATAIAAGQTSAGGNDAYLTKLDPKGTVLYHRQFGTASSDSAAKTAIASDGNPIVASVQNGHAILTKFDGANGTGAALWEIDLGDLQGGTIGGLTLSGNQIYLSGTTANAALDAGGAASLVEASSGGTDAFVFNLTDAGASATAGFVSYVGTANSEQAGGVAVAGGKIYLAGTTTGTFAGETRAVEGTHNMFVAALDAGGALDWAKQYGGLDGQSTGNAIAADETGASVLDALGLPRGKIDVNQSNTIESQTTAHPGDYFSMKVTDRSGTRTVKITLSKGETLRSLATKINASLLFSGQAKVMPVKGGQSLKIAANTGVQIQIVAGAKDFDALAGLGIKEQTLVNDAPESDSKAAAKAAAASGKTIGLGIAGGLGLTTKKDAGHAHVVLLGAMAQIKQAYGALNNPKTDAALPGIGNAPVYLQNRLAGYQTALTWMRSLNGGQTTLS